MYYKNFYKNLSEKEIKDKIIEEGFNPIKVEDDPNYEYQTHTHEETKILAILKGGMCVTVNGEHFVIEPGDKLVIPGNIPHSAQVGDRGCTYFWSEKIIR